MGTEKQRELFGSLPKELQSKVYTTLNGAARNFTWVSYLGLSHG